MVISIIESIQFLPSKVTPSNIFFLPCFARGKMYTTLKFGIVAHFSAQYAKIVWSLPTRPIPYLSVYLYRE